uniref:HTH OST-type domain-containing protein n=1 Tax=Clastoptera arizonana TaxID=38151 RepID=A0A1B6DPC6_9HEMI
MQPDLTTVYHSKGYNGCLLESNMSGFKVPLQPKVMLPIQQHFSDVETTSDSQSDASTKDSSSFARRNPVHPMRGYQSDESSLRNVPPPIGVFWDIENCQIPRGRSAVTVAQAIRDEFFCGYREVEFVVVCDVKKETPQVVQDLDDAQVNIIHVEAKSKNAADEKLRQSIRKFADIHKSPSAVILISGDVNFAPDLNYLRRSKNIHVILIHNDHCADCLTICANEHYSFSSLVSKLPYRSITKCSNQPSEVLVTNLPIGQEHGRVRRLLKRLAENCGGKVGKITIDNTTRIRFPTSESAARAQKRMNGENVLGSIIVVGNPIKLLAGTSLKSNSADVISNNEHHPYNNERLVQNHLSSKYSWENNIQQSQISSKAALSPMQQLGNIQLRLFGNTSSGHLSNTNNWLSQPHQIRLEENHLIKSKSSSEINHCRAILGAHTLNGGLNGCVQTPVALNFQKSLNTTLPTTQNNFQHGNQLDTIMDSKNINSPHSRSMDFPTYANKLCYLQVTCLDMSLKPLQFKKALISELKDKFLILHILAGYLTDGTLSASIKLPNMQDVIKAKNHLKQNLKWISIKSLPIRSQVIAILSEVPGYSLPLSKFVEIYQIRYCSTLDTSNLNLLSDICNIGESVKSGGPVISLNIASKEQKNTCGGCLSSNLSGSSLPKVKLRLSEFSRNLKQLLLTHNNIVPLSNLLQCYEANFGQIIVKHDGVPLEYMIMWSPGVKLDQNLKAVQIPEKESSKDKRKLGPEVFNFSNDLIELIRAQPRCQLLFKQLIELCYNHFGEECIQNSGFSKLKDLMLDLSDYIQVIGSDYNQVAVLTPEIQRNYFSEVLRQILRNTPNKQFKLPEFEMLHERLLGIKFDPVCYGLCYLEDLLTQFDGSLINVTGSGPSYVVSLQENNEMTKKNILRFESEVLELLSLSPDYRLEFSKFIGAYYQHFKRNCKISDYGFTRLAPLLNSMSHIVKIEDIGNIRYIVLTIEKKIYVVGQQILHLLKGFKSPPQLPVCMLTIKFHDNYGYTLKPESFGCVSVFHLLEKLSPKFEICNIDGLAVLTLPNQHLQNLSLQVRKILMEQPNAKMTLTNFQKIYQRLYNCDCNLETLEISLADIVKVRQDKSKEIIIQLTSLQLFSRDVYMLLTKSGGRLTLGSFETSYMRMFGTAIQPKLYGFQSVFTLLQAIPETVEIKGKGNKQILILNKELYAAGINLSFKQERERSTGSG